MSADTKTEPSPSGRGLMAELGEFWRELPDRWLFVALFGAWLALFHFLGNSTLGYVRTPSLFGWWWWVETIVGRRADGSVDWGVVFDSDGSFALIMPLVIAVLFVWKRDELRALPKRVWWPAAGLLALALLLHALGFMVQQTRISVVGFFAGVYALSGLIWGSRWLAATFFPFFLFAFCVPLTSGAEAITFPLRMLVTILSVGIGHNVLGVDVVREGTLIFNSAHTFQYDVAPACSGIRSLMTLLALTTIYGFLTLRKAWKRCLMVLLAFPLAVIGNTVRITCVIVAGEAFGQEAGKAIEQNLGFVTFLVALAAVLAIGHWLREDKSKPSVRSAGPSAPVATAASAQPETPV